MRAYKVMIADMLVGYFPTFMMARFEALRFTGAVVIRTRDGIEVWS